MTSIYRQFVSFIAYIFSKSYLLTQFSRLVVKISDNDCNNNFSRNGEYFLQKAIASFSLDESIFFDIGCNSGFWSRSLVDAHFRGRIILVDPLQINLSQASANLSNLPHILFHTVLTALSDSIGTATFHVNSDPTKSGHDSLLDMNSIGYFDSTSTVLVPTTTLDKLCADMSITKILFAKIDVEGFELFVLNGARDLIQNQAIDFIQFEFGHASRASRTYLHDLVNFFMNFSYDLFVIKPKGLSPLNFDPFTENRYSQVNLVAVSTSSLNQIKRFILPR